MELRDKVRLTVSHCLRSNDCSICEACPYNERNDYGCRARLRDDIIKLLKDQEPIKVRDRILGIDGWGGYCSICGSFLLEHHNKHFCGNCGREVKWE